MALWPGKVTSTGAPGILYILLSAPEPVQYFKTGGSGWPIRSASAFPPQWQSRVYQHHRSGLIHSQQQVFHTDSTVYSLRCSSSMVFMVANRSVR